MASSRLCHTKRSGHFHACIYNSQSLESALGVLPPFRTELENRGHVRLADHTDRTQTYTVKPVLWWHADRVYCGQRKTAQRFERNTVGGTLGTTSDLTIRKCKNEADVIREMDGEKKAGWNSLRKFRRAVPRARCLCQESPGSSVQVFRSGFARIIRGRYGPDT
jgi:hypothetical protein